MIAPLLAACGVLPGTAPEPAPLSVPVMRSAEPPPVWASDPSLPEGAAWWAERRCAADPAAPLGEGCAWVAPAVCAELLPAPHAWWDVLVGCPDPAVGEAMLAEGADPALIARWFVAHDRWDARLTDVVLGLADRPAGVVLSAVTALARRESPATTGFLTEAWDDRADLRRVLATAVAASSDPGLAARLAAWCEGREDYRCDPGRQRELRLAAHPVDDLAGALASPWALPHTWLEAWPSHRSAILDAHERAARADEPGAAARSLKALALADRPRAAVVAGSWDEDAGSTFEGWDLRTALTSFPDPAAWEARVVAAGGALPAAHLLDGWIRSGAAFPALDEGWAEGGPTALLARIFARVPGDDPVFSHVDPDVREAPFRTRVALYAWWNGERWRVAEAGDPSVASVGLANVLLAEMGRPERVGLTGDAAWVVVADPERLAAAGRERLVTWYDPSWQAADPPEPEVW